MNELSNQAGGAPLEEHESNLSQSTPSANGAEDTSPQASATHMLAPRAITSKRVVIPPNAKRIAKTKPTETQVNVVPVTTVPPSAFPETARAETQTALTPPASLETGAWSAEPTITSESGTAELPALAKVTVPDSLSVNPLFSERTDDSPSVHVEPSPTTNAATVEPAPTVTRVSPSVIPARTRGSGLKPSALPYQLAETELTPIPITPPSRSRTLEFVLWSLAALALVAALLLVANNFFPNLLPNLVGTAGVQPTATTVAVVPTTAPTATSTLLPTDAPTPIIPPTSAPLVLPTPPADGTQFSTLPIAGVTGWIANDEETPHYADVNLHAGTFQGQALSSIVQFNLRNNPKDSKILYAALELTGRDASRLGQDGEWQIEILENSPTTNWREATSEQIAQAKTLGTIGTPLTFSDLGQGRLNRFILNATELQLLEQQFQNGNVVLRLRGPVGDGDNLFTWESGVGSTALSAPTLHLVLVPGQFVIVTNTPPPENILTAAAYVVRGTDRAKRNGTPTSFPPGVATATPGGEVVIIPAETAIAQNRETADARAAIATAFARTTGTYTPTPPSIIQFPTFTPVIITNVSTATPIPPDANLLAIPIDYTKCRCQGRILLLSDRFGGDKGNPIMLAADGTELGKLSGDLYYNLALAREPYSPDRKKKIIYPNDPNGVQQIGYLDLETNEVVILTNFSKGIAYAGAWSPDGNANAIAFVSTERGNTDEIYVYDFGTQTSTRITEAPENLLPLTKHPSWSPDSQQIVFWSTRDGTPQIWVMNRDGSNLRNISNNSFNETNPVWVK